MHFEIPLDCTSDGQSSQLNFDMRNFAMRQEPLISRTCKPLRVMPPVSDQGFLTKRKIAFICIFIFALLGMAISIFLTDFHYKLLAKQESSDTAICSLSSSFNCDLVNSSPYSELFSIPIALWGLFFYLIFFTVASWSLRTTEQTSFSVFLHCLAIWAVLYSAYLFYIAEFVIGALCPYCIMLYAVNIGLFVSTKIYAAKTYKEMWTYLRSFFAKKENATQ